MLLLPAGLAVLLITYESLFITFYVDAYPCYFVGATASKVGVRDLKLKEGHISFLAFDNYFLHHRHQST
jgi:hypothetical protein